MQVSVVIPTMNKVRLLRRTLTALHEQGPRQPEAWEVVVVNDGSSDGTAAYLADLVGWERPALRVVAPPRNVGRARARNLGARAARGRYLLFLDDDIVAPPGLVQAHLDALDGSEDRGTIGYAVTAPELVDAPHFYYLDTRGAARLPAGSAPGRYFVTQNAAVPRAAFLSVGGFDEDFAAYGFEDMEVAFRLEDRAGLSFVVLSEPVPQHVHYHSSDEYFAKKVECGRYSLPHLARLHPGRIAEMRLHHIVDTPGAKPPDWRARSLRRLAVSPLGRSLPRLLAFWPMRPGGRPMAAGLYLRMMNLAVVCAYRQGVVETAKQY